MKLYHRGLLWRSFVIVLHYAASWGYLTEIKKKYAMQAERLFHYLAPLIPRIKIHVIVHSPGIMT